MKQYLGWVVSAAVATGATAANAQVLMPYRIGMPPAVVVSDVYGPSYGPYAAMPPEMAPRYAPTVLSMREIDAIVRESGFSPLGAPQQRGLVYTVAAMSEDGEDGRLVIDARSGRIVRFMPAWRMGERMGEETVTAYGPVGALPPAPDYRRPAHPPAPRLASRTPTVPLPKASPPRAVATPAKPVAPTPSVAVAPEVKPAAPAAQQAVVAPKTDEVRVIPLTPAPAAETPPAAAPTVAAPPVEAKPSATADTPAPPVQPTE